MPYKSKAEEEAASEMTWTELIRHVKNAEGDCAESEARRQIGNAIQDGVLTTRWDDERIRWGSSGPLQPTEDKPPRDAAYWLECEADSTVPDRVLEPRPYDPELVDKETAERLDRMRRFRKPLFWRDHALRRWKTRSSATARDETLAITFLMKRLKVDNNLRRQDALEAGRGQFPKLSERGFRSRVWPQAREAAGLERTAPPGRKSKPK